MNIDEKLNSFLDGLKDLDCVPDHTILDNILYYNLVTSNILFEGLKDNIKKSSTLQTFILFHHLVRLILKLPLPSPSTLENDNDVALLEFKYKQIKSLILDIAVQKTCLQPVMMKVFLKLLFKKKLSILDVLDSSTSTHTSLLDQIRKGKRSFSNTQSSRNYELAGLSGHDVAKLNALYALKPKAIKVIPSQTQAYIFDVLLMSYQLIQHNKVHLISIFTGTLLSITESSHAPHNMDHYNDILPEKPTFERDIYIERLFLKYPYLLDVLDIIADHPKEFCSLYDIMKSLLASIIGSWNSETLLPVESFWINHTLSLVQLLQKVEWIPPKMRFFGDIIPHLKPKEIAQLLLSVWYFIKDHLPRPNNYTASSHDEKTTFYVRKWANDLKQESYLSTYKLLLKQNAPSLYKYAHLYRIVFEN